MKPIGFVYVLSNRCMPGVYKIGMTTYSPNTRARELSKWTGVPTPFVVEYYVEVEDPKYIERQVHADLEPDRVSESREFFETDPFVIDETIVAITEDTRLSEYYTDWWASETGNLPWEKVKDFPGSMQYGIMESHGEYRRSITRA